ncbi:ABC transporter ATP-binding protein [Shouchella sp. JSM 1781072]|uniref:ABC transporter ATP-binding protein n=1 Tax=Bacillaceae TaxID=186817 RepID=UPI0020D13FEE|nr:ABC transporter ATP-binding protein [Alkalihalobacillus sp. LMS6]UTR08204.1 ABC transporter ATP-binding protein [Alkalihalobacillus sp. LMS6]
MEQIVRCKNVTWVREGRNVLSDINWEMNQGEHWCVLGLNGSGKTTLLNLINGYRFPTLGEISVLGQVSGKTNFPELRKRIGYVSSSLDSFLPIMQREGVEEVVVSGKFASFGLYEKVSDQDWQRAEEILRSLRLHHLRGKTFGVLSQGEQRRVLIGRALMSSPDILILDEPCTGLDVPTREEMLSLMEEIKARGCHLIYVTHHIEEVSPVLTHVLMIQDGKVAAAGPKQKVLTSSLLSKVFKLPVDVEWMNDRPWLKIVSG